MCCSKPQCDGPRWKPGQGPRGWRGMSHALFNKAILFYSLDWLLWRLRWSWRLPGEGQRWMSWIEKVTLYLHTGCRVLWTAFAPCPRPWSPPSDRPFQGETQPVPARHCPRHETLNHNSRLSPRLSSSLTDTTASNQRLTVSKNKPCPFFSSIDHYSQLQTTYFPLII